MSSTTVLMQRVMTIRRAGRICRRLCAASAVLLIACGGSGPAPGGGEGPATNRDTSAALPTSITFSAAQVQHGGVRWGPVTMGTASGTAVVPGQVSPDEDRTLRLGAPARGRVLTVPVRPGDRVTAGRLLVTMQSPEAGVAQSDLSKAAAELSARRAEGEYAASARGRAERLLALQAIPRQDYERAISDDEHARAAVAQAEAEIRRARATAEQLGVDTSTNGEVALRASTTGVVLTRMALPGAVVDAGAPLVVVTDPSRLWLTIAAPEALAGFFHRGERIHFTVPAYAADTFTARIDAVGAGLDPDTHTLSVRAVIANRDGRLKPQMLATVVVERAGTTPAAFVPPDAVQSLQGKSYVFLARADDQGGATFERREVVLGARSADRLVVLRGIGAGDVIVLAGAFAIKAELQKATVPEMEM